MIRDATNLIADEDFGLRILQSVSFPGTLAASRVFEEIDALVAKAVAFKKLGTPAGDPSNDAFWIMYEVLKATGFDVAEIRWVEEARFEISKLHERCFAGKDAWASHADIPKASLDYFLAINAELLRRSERGIRRLAG